MQNIRPISEEKWNITKHAFYEAYHFAMRYNEFMDILRYNTDTVGGFTYGEKVKSSRDVSSQTEKLAIKRANAERNCRMIEETAKEADKEINSYILKAVTEEGITYRYLRSVMNIPCGKNLFYEKRRKFYYLLSKKMDKQ